MAKIEKETAEKILKTYFSILSKIFDTAFTRYQKITDRFDHTARTRASLIHDFIIAECANTFANHRDVRLRCIKGLSVLEFLNHNLFLRFKKLDRRYNAANIPTQQSLMYEHIQLPLWSHLPETTYLTAGYVPSKDWTKIKSKAVTCKNGKDLEWMLPVKDVERVPILIDLTINTEAMEDKPIARAKQALLPKDLNRRKTHGEDSR